MPDRLPVSKTYKLFIAGKFPRSESGRSVKIESADGHTLAHTCRASRKDLRAAVEAARSALPKWSDAPALLRGQILYRMAEMLEGKQSELITALQALGNEDAGTEVATSIDRLIAFAGWADKFPQVLGCANPVSGPYHNFTIPTPTGVVGIISPDDPPLLGLVSLLAPVICSGNTAILLASQANPIIAAIFAEVCATSDVPAGVVNILTGDREELTPHFASHRDINAIHAADVSPDQRTLLEEGAAENLKRITIREGIDWDTDACEDPWWVESFVEFKTLWHPSAT